MRRHVTVLGLALCFLVGTWLGSGSVAVGAEILKIGNTVPLKSKEGIQIKNWLELLAERIIPGTVIVFDEYIGNERWREDEFRAFQEAVVRYGWAYEYLCFSFVTKQVVVRILAGIL